ncbi:DUF6976 family protein [Alloyangia pacifica]|uniref:DUF6976 family protein n=1 Tax=Alloyangia pacifica TaxID=311180 RepID=UPI001CD313A6|nr:hypothetical protein [Alloyangia pacifica]MCA0997541.1 hypothetical protein [Alloyangia pacifica]
MKNQMMTPEQAAARIDAGATLVIAGDEEVLTKLPRGRWIGGTTVYFMTETGGHVDRENVFVTELEAAEDARAVLYEGEDLPSLTMGRFDNGLSVILIPAFSKAHEAYAIHGAEYPGLFDQPVMGWITGVHLDELASATPKVIDGTTGRVHQEGALVLHVNLSASRSANVEILNLFTQDDSGPELTFPATGFAAETARIDGKEVDFAKWVEAQGIDTRLPLVANYAGALVNVSFQSVGPEGVAFYAPVIEGVSYRLAASPGDYATVFARQAQGDGAQELSCNCILNFLFGELQDKRTGSFTGPVTFGEIAYILLNQTMVRLQLHGQDQAAVA